MLGRWSVPRRVVQALVVPGDWLKMLPRQAHRPRGAVHSVRVVALLAGLWLAATAGAAQPPRPIEPVQRFALVVGNSSYTGIWSDLRGGPRADAQAMVTALAGLGFTIVNANGDRRPYLDLATQSDFLAALRHFRERVKAASGPGPKIAWVFYSGHGFLAKPVDEQPEESWFVPTRAALQAAYEAPNHAVRQSDVTQALLASGADVSVLVVDACRDNALSRSARGLTPPTAPGVLVAYSTDLGDTAANRPGTTSAYTAALAAALAQPGWRLTDVLAHVREEVMQQSRNTQQPLALNGMSRDVVLSSGHRPVDVTPGQTSVVTVASNALVPSVEIAPPMQASVATSISKAPGSKFRDRLKDGSEGPLLVVVPSGEVRFEDENGKLETKGEQVSTFALGAHEVTVAEFRSFVRSTGYVTDAERKTALGSPLDELVRSGCAQTFPAGSTPSVSWADPGYPQADDHPVVCVSATDAEAFSKWLSDQTGARYRLPKDSEVGYVFFDDGNGSWRKYLLWRGDEERACRYANVLDGTFWRALTRQEMAEQCDPEEGGCPRSARVECVDGFRYTSPVGSFGPSRLGFFDLVGNVMEWYTTPAGSREPYFVGTASFTSYLPDETENWTSPNWRSSEIGFRIVREM